MIRKNQRFITLASAIIDYIVVVVAYLLSNYIRFYILHGNPGNIYATGKNNIGLALAYATIVTIAFSFLRIYKFDRTYEKGRSFGRVLLANFIASASLLSVFYITHLVDVSRMVIFFTYLISTVSLVLKRVIERKARHARIEKGLGLNHVVLIGGSKLAARYVKEIKKRPYLGIWIDGYIADNRNSDLDCEYLGNYEKLESILMDSKMFEAVVAIDAKEMDMMNLIMSVCDKCGTRFSIIPAFNDYLPHNATVDDIGRCKLINVRETPFDFIGNAVIKRTFDVVGSLILIILTSPVLIFCAIGVKLSSPGPIIFTQERVGLNKKTFNMYKFRSMRINVESSTAWSTDNDPRKTKFGSFIRKFSLDELPQFFNVLKGDMSLVGPRPEIPFHVSHFKDEIPLYLVRQQVRPGCTGWAQIHGLRGDTDIAERIEYDIWYIEHWTLWLDIRIILGTVFGGKMVNSEQISK